MNCSKCISHKRCKENKTLMDNCIWFLDEESVLINERASLKKCPFCEKEAVALRNIEDGIVAYRVRCSNAHCLARTQWFPALLIFTANRLDNGQQVKGYYWYVEEHHIENMSGKHYIKSIKNGIDYEIDISTIAEFNEDIENIEKAKAKLKVEISNPFIRILDWLERLLSK